jgi:hypothetical protein
VGFYFANRSTLPFALIGMWVHHAFCFTSSHSSLGAVAQDTSRNVELSIIVPASTALLPANEIDCHPSSESPFWEECHGIFKLLASW